MERHRQYVLLLLQVILFVEGCFAENLILNVNLKGPIAVTNEAFLSFTLDPETLLRNIDDLTKNIEISTNMLRSLAPAYIRLAGPQSNTYIFGQTDLNDVAANSSDMFSEMQWALMHQWAGNAGLDVIACIAPRFIGSESKTHPRGTTNATEFLSFSDQMDYNISWQLGYECQAECEFSGGDLGRCVRNLRDLMLEAYPRYSNSLIIGPDIVAYRTTQQQRYLQDYFSTADDALSAITWHPNFASVSLNDGNVSVHRDNLAAEMDEIYKIIGRIVGNKPLWIAESKSEEYKHQHLGALIWTRRLGDAAKLGIQVVMRQLQNLSRPTPDYWVSLLHKTLVGPEVLETSIRHSDNVHYYSQCTKRSGLYDKGAVTIFGVNLTPGTVTANLKGLDINTLHKYIVSPDVEAGDKMFSEKVLLNNKPLNLIDDKRIPDLQPEIVTDSDNLKLSSGDIGFWVIPDAKVKACMDPETIVNAAVKKLSKRHEDAVGQDQDKRTRKDTSESDLKARSKIYAKQERRKRKDTENENQQGIRNNKLLGRLTRILQKRLPRKSDPSNYQRSVTVILKEGQEASEEEEPPNLSVDIFKAADPSKLGNVRDTSKRHKRSLRSLKKKDQMASEDLRTENLDDAVTLKIDTLLGKKGLTSNELIASKMKDVRENEAKLTVGLDEKLKEYLNTLENCSRKTDKIDRLKEYFNMLFTILQDSGATRDDEDEQTLIQKNSIQEKKRFKRDLNAISTNSKEVKVLGKQTDDSKNRMVKRRIKRKIVRKRKVSSDNPIKTYNQDNGRRLPRARQGSVKRFLENESSNVEIDRRAVQQKCTRESKRRKRIGKKKAGSKSMREIKNIKRKFETSKLHMEKNSMQKHDRTKREISKQLVGTSLRKKNIEKRSRVDTVKDYPNERKTTKKNDFRKEGFLVPFNARVTESDEDDFYGFFRRGPMNNFPEGDIFLTTGDSIEQQTGKDYDYVEDDNDDIAGQKNRGYEQISKSEEKPQMGNNHRDYVLNEFVENMKLSDERTEDAKDYDDLWEAQYFSEEHENKDANMETESGFNDKRSVAEILRHKRSNREAESKHTEEMQHDRKHEATGLNRFSRNFNDQPAENSVYVNRHASAVRLPAEAKLNPSKSKAPFYRPVRAFAARHNYDNYQASTFTSTAKYDEAKGKYSLANTPNGKNDINTINFHILADADPISDGNSPQNGRTRRSDWKKLRMDLAREMIEGDESNAKDCHCRVIRATEHSPREFRDCRVKRDDQASDSASVIESVEDDSTESAHLARDVRNLMTKEDYEQIMTGDILATSNSDGDTIAETTVTESSGTEDDGAWSHDDGTQTSLPVDSSTISIPEQSNKVIVEEPITETILADSTLGLSLSNDGTTVEDITKRTFFRTQSQSDVQTEKETYDLRQIDHRTHSNDREDPVSSSVTGSSQKATREKKEIVADKEEEIENFTRSATIGTNHEDKERQEDNHTSSLRTSVSVEEMAVGTETTETILSKRALDKSTDNSRSKEIETTPRNAKDSLRNKPKDERKSKKNADGREAKNVARYFSKMPLREKHGKTEEDKRTEQIDKRKVRMHGKRERLLRQQLRQELSRIVDREEKRKLNRREAWERFYENDDFHQPTDRAEFIDIRMDDDISYEDDEEPSDDEEYDVVPIELTRKQYNALVHLIHPFARRVHGPKCDRSQLVRQLELLADEESTESSCGSDRRIFAIRPSMYRGGEPIMDYLKSPRYHSRIKPEIQIPKWMLKDYLEISDKDRHPVSKLREHARKSPMKDRETADGLYILDARISDLSKELVRVRLRPIDQGDVNRAARNKIQDGSSDTHGNFEEQHDVLDSIPVTEKETGLFGDFDSESNTEFDNEQKDTLSFVTTENTDDADEITTRNKKSENIKSTRHVKTEKDTQSEQLANDKKEDTFNVRAAKDLRNRVEKVKRSENADIDKGETLNARKAAAKIRRLNRKNKNVVEDKDTETDKSHFNSNEVRENIKISNDNEAIEDVAAESTKLEKDVARTRKSIKKPTSNNLEQPPYFLLTRNARDRPTRGIHIYLEKNSEMFNRPDQRIFLRKKSDSVENDSNTSKDVQVSAESSKFLTKPWADFINKHLDNEYSYNENFEFDKIFLPNLLKKMAKDVADEEPSASEQDTSVDDSRINYESRKKDEEYGSESEESDYGHRIKMINELKPFDSMQPIHRIILLLPWKNDKRRRRQIEENEINENVGEIKRESRQCESSLAEDKSAEYHLNDNSIKKEEREKVTKMKNVKTNYLKPKMDKRNYDDLLEDFIEARKKNNLYSEIPLFMKNKNEDKNAENNILKSDGKLLSLMEEPISTSENLIVTSEKTQNLVEPVKQFVDNFEEKSKKTIVLERSKNETSEANSNNPNVGFIEKLFAFLSKLPWIFIK